MIVKAGAEEALQFVAGQDDALQHRRKLLDCLDAGATEFQLMPNPARLAQMRLAHACRTFSAAASSRSAMASTSASVRGGSWVRR